MTSPRPWSGSFVNWVRLTVYWVTEKLTLEEHHHYNYRTKEFSHITPNTYQNKKAITLVCKSLPFNLLKETYKYLNDNTYSPEQMSFILPHANYRIAQFVKKIPTLLNNQFGKCSSLRHQIYNCINSRNLHFLLYSEPYPMPGSQRLQLNWCDIIHIRSLPPTTVQQIHIFCSIHHTQLANMI